MAAGVQPEVRSHGQIVRGHGAASDVRNGMCIKPLNKPLIRPFTTGECNSPLLFTMQRTQRTETLRMNPRQQTGPGTPLKGAP
eukprot:7624637-Pyramimonas_sp.AAC.1